MKHPHYFKPVAHLETIDVYRVLALFNVADPCLQHAIKKLLVAGGRGAGKDPARDIQEAIDSLTRWQEMHAEDLAALQKAPMVAADGRRPCACSLSGATDFSCKGRPLPGQYCVRSASASMVYSTNA